MTDKDTAEGRRNKTMGEWIRQHRSTQTLPLDLKALGAGDEGDAPLASSDSGAQPAPSMNDLLRGSWPTRDRNR